MKIAVYTAITGRRDDLKLSQNYEGADFLLFTDTSWPLTGEWQTRHLSASGDVRRAAKDPKVRSYKFVREYDYSIWMDGACTLLEPAASLIEKYLVDTDVALFKNPQRDCVYDEATFGLRLALDDAHVLAAQIKRYEAAGIPAHAGLFEAGVILRRHSTEVTQWEDLWWDEIARGSVRDQISLPVSLHAAGIVPAIIPGNIRQNPFFTYMDHPVTWRRK